MYPAIYGRSLSGSFDVGSQPYSGCSQEPSTRAQYGYDVLVSLGKQERSPSASAPAPLGALLLWGLLFCNTTPKVPSGAPHASLLVLAASLTA